MARSTTKREERAKLPSLHGGHGHAGGTGKGEVFGGVQVAARHPPTDQFGLIDFSGFEFDENEKVDARLVPKVEGKVCMACSSEEKSAACAVTWHRLPKGRVKFWCDSCRTNNHGCSFRDDRWGISKFPSLRATEGGEKRRESNRLLKQKSRIKIKAAEEKLKKVHEEEMRRKHDRKRADRGLRGSKRQKSKGLGVRSTAGNPSSPGPSSPGPSSKSTGGLKLRDLGTFDSLLSNPESSTASLKEALVKIKEAEEEEEEVFAGRSEKMRTMILKLGDRLEKLQGEDSDE